MSRVRSLFARLDPRLYVIEIPDDAARREVETPRKFAAAFHFVDRSFGQGNDLPQFVAANGAAEGKSAAFRKLRQRFIGFRPRQSEGATAVDTGVGWLRYGLHIWLHQCLAVWRYVEVRHLSEQLAVE